MGRTGCPETSVRNCHYTLRNSPEKHSSHLLRGVCLKSRKKKKLIFRAQQILQGHSINDCVSSNFVIALTASHNDYSHRAPPPPKKHLASPLFVHTHEVAILMGNLLQKNNLLASYAVLYFRQKLRFEVLHF